MRTKLVGSAPTLEGLISLIKSRWYWSEVYISESGEVSNSKGVVDGLKVRNVKGRFRLEIQS
jgi:hypothetical protein